MKAVTVYFLLCTLEVQKYKNSYWLIKVGGKCLESTILETFAEHSLQQLDSVALFLKLELFCLF